MTIPRSINAVSTLIAIVLIALPNHWPARGSLAQDIASESFTANQQVRQLISAGNLQQALVQAAEALKHAQATWGEEHPHTASAFHNYADVLRHLGRPAEGLHYSERALSLYAKVHGEKHPDTLAAVGKYALTLRALGRSAEALAQIERALKLQTELLGESHPGTLASLSIYAGLLDLLGRSAEALPLSERTLKLRTEVLGEKHVSTLQSLNSYAHLLRQTGQTVKALPYIERVMKLSTEVLGDRHPLTMRSLLNYALALETLGRTADALPHHERALKLRSEVLGERHPDTLWSLNNYANALRVLGRTAEALALHERTLKLRAEVLGERHPDTLYSLTNYARVLRVLGRTEEALAFHERTLKLRTEVLGERHPDTLFSLNNYALALHERDRTAEALQYYERGIKLGAEVLGDQHTTMLMLLSGYPDALNALGRMGEALTYFSRFVAGVEALRDEAGRDTAESQRGVLSRFVYGYHNYLNALTSAGQAQDALSILERTKARTLLDQTTLRAAALSGGVPGERARAMVDYSSLIGAIDTRIASAANSAEIETLKAQRNATSRNLAALKRSLQAEYPRFRQLTEVPLANADDAQALLPPGSLFVSYVAMQGNRLKAAALDATGAVRWFDLPNVVGLADTVEALRVWSSKLIENVMVDDRGRRVQILHWTDGNYPRWRVVTAGQVCSTEQILQDKRQYGGNATRGVMELRGLDAPTSLVSSIGADCIPPGASFVSSTAQRQELLDFMAKVLVEPLRTQLTGKTRLVISPDGPLGLIPWDVLPLDGKPLLAQFEISQVQSLSVLKLLKERQAEYNKDSGRAALLAMGNPDYGRSSDTTSPGTVVLRSPMKSGANPLEMLRQLKWASLPGTQVEIEQAARIFGGQSRVIGGKAASETTLRELSVKGELAKYRYLHFAAHGYFDPNVPAYSSLVLAPDGVEPERDGYVTIGEWMGMNLKSDLTLLSACNTARGASISGEGLVGLSYALYVAGNTNTLVTLWPVADEETTEFVTSLLTRIKAGQSHAQAVTETKREFLNHPNPRKRNPYFWAPFVLYGV